MSLKFRDQNGATHTLAGLTPGGDLEYGAVAVRDGSFTITIPSNAYERATITFSEPMPDDDYVIAFDSDTSMQYCFCEAYGKTANGFGVTVNNTYTSALTRTISYKAFKLYEVADAEQLMSDVTDLKAMIPANASSSNKLSTANDLSTETRSLDRRLDNVEDVVPSSATISNKLVTANDLATALTVTDTIPSSPQDGDVLLYVGTASGFTKGGIYQYDAANTEWVLISTADIDVDSAISSTSENPVQNKVIKAELDKKEDLQFTGTKAEWNALTADQKKSYKIANITDDYVGSKVVDEIAEGVMDPVTSNAVAKDKKFVTLWSGKVTSGTVTLSQPYTKFRKIYLLMGISGGASTAKHQAELLTDFMQVSPSMVVSACAGTGTQVYVSGFLLTFTTTSITISGAYYYNWTSPSLEKVIGEY